ncbi:hypothetical protein [Sphingobacterium bovistauri]|uniref:DUF1735 domain-containing protein n=1 Tax=Sphingobacterium bovistauri TaxID=2781959 RepID=A0ABS7Z4B8_9SPHI|nr:hypothetical protein [Sphingobacterium bovistauri]MCA5004392.1 hypothetical protein [Sphingobacterium bovistauri]
MKTNIIKNSILASLLICVGLMFFSCSKESELDRAYEEVKIVGVKINDVLHYPTYDGDNTIVDMPAGTDVSNVALELLVVNGELQGFPQQLKYDARKPMDVSLVGKNGVNKQGKLLVKSAPLLRNLIIEGLIIPQTDIHYSASSIVVQVPELTDLKNLKLTLEFVNGEMVDFQNGVEKDYTNSVPVKVKGIDETTIYNYDLIVTSEQVGPALIKGMTINGIETDSVQVLANNVVVPFVKGLSNFSNANLSMETGFANVVDPSFVGTGLNLMSGNNKVKITGSDGIQMEFTIAQPKLSLVPKTEILFSSLGLGANDLIGSAFSNGSIVIPSHTTNVGMHVYGLNGVRSKILSIQGLTFNHSLRQVASDEKGKILGIALGVNGAAVNVYKWDNVDATPSLYLSHTQQSLGLSYQPRTAGITITGSLDGDATIVITLAGKTDVVVYKVAGGVLNTTPQKLSIPAAGTNYFEVSALPNGRSGYIGTWVNSVIANYGLFSLNNTMNENFKISGQYTTANKFFTYKGRDYVSYTIFQANRGMIMRLIDFTNGELNAFQNPILDVLMPSNAANGNATMDTDIAIINNKLHVMYSCSNIGIRVYQVEE